MTNQDSNNGSTPLLPDNRRMPQRSLGYAMKAVAESNRADSMSLTELLNDVIRGSIPVNTRRAYAADQATFDKFRLGMDVQEPNPSDLAVILLYIIARVQEGRTPDTVIRNITGLMNRYDAEGVPFPLSLKAIKRFTHVVWRDHAKARGIPHHRVRQVNALVDEVLLKLVAGCDLTDPSGIRDKALITVGKYGMARRSELTSMQIEDIQFYAESVRIKIWNAKTSSPTEPQWLTLYHLSDKRLCPICALKQHLHMQGRDKGPAFLAIDKYGNVRDFDEAGNPATRGLSGVAIATLIKSLAMKAGFDPREFSGHGMRRGGITDARRQKRGFAEIMVSARIVLVETLERYTDYAIILGGQSNPNFRETYIVDAGEAVA